MKCKLSFQLQYDCFILSPHPQFVLGNWFCRGIKVFARSRGAPLKSLQCRLTTRRTWPGMTGAASSRSSSSADPRWARFPRKRALNEPVSRGDSHNSFRPIIQTESAFQWGRLQALSLCLSALLDGRVGPSQSLNIYLTLDVAAGSLSAGDGCASELLHRGGGQAKEEQQVLSQER